MSEEKMDGIRNAGFAQCEHGNDREAPAHLSSEETKIYMAGYDEAKERGLFNTRPFLRIKRPDEK